MNISPTIRNNVIAAYSSHYMTTPEVGMQQASLQAKEASHRLASGELTSDNVVSLNASLYSFKANAITLKSMDEMQGTLLNVLA